MSEPIKVGDLVIIVKPRICGCNGSLGEIHTVLRYSTDHRMGWCDKCRKITYGPHVPTVMLSENTHTEVSRLKRIPPLGELEGVDEKETLHA